MTAYKPEAILTRLEAAIRKQPLTQPQVMPGDKWLLSSALQKSIRRGEAEAATRAAAAYWYQERTGFWRRLGIISLEDVGVANPVLIAEVLTAVTSPEWRRRVGDLRVGLYLVNQLCRSIKTRLADELLLQAERASIHNSLRQELASASDNELADYITDDANPLLERALSAWYLTGTSKFPTERMPARKGSPQKTIEVLRSLPVPLDLLESCITVLFRTQWPLALFTPLIWQELQKQKGQLLVKHSAILPTSYIDDMPCYAADLYTRTGQSCYRQLQKTVPELQSYSFRQIGVAVFYFEGGVLDRVISSLLLDDFSVAGELAEAESEGLSPEEYVRLKYLMSQNMELLEHIRREQLQRYFNGALPGNVNAIQGKPTFTHSDVKGGN